MKEWCVEKVQITLSWDLELALHWAVQMGDGGGYMNISEKVNFCIKKLTAVRLLLCASSLPSFSADFLWNLFLPFIIK